MLTILKETSIGLTVVIFFLQFWYPICFMIMRTLDDYTKKVGDGRASENVFATLAFGSTFFVLLIITIGMCLWGCQILGRFLIQKYYELKKSL